MHTTLLDCLFIIILKVHFNLFVLVETVKFQLSEHIQIK
jgi:hypothetical protein